MKMDYRQKMNRILQLRRQIEAAEIHNDQVHMRKSQKEQNILIRQVEVEENQ